MYYRSGFDRLVSEISEPERQNLLSELEDKVQVSDEPIRDEAGEEDSPLNPEVEYQRFGLLEKLWIFLKKLISGRERNEVVAETLTERLGRQLEESIPGMVDVRRRTLSSAFYQELEKLRRAVMIYKGPLDRALSQKKQEFFAFLGGREFEGVEQKLRKDLDPWEVLRSNPYHSNQEVKDILEADFDLILEDIPEEDRKRVYQYARTLSLLHRLCRFSFQPLMNQFPVGSDGLPGEAKAAGVKDSLAELTEILWNLRVPPSFQTLEALILFYEQDHLDEAGFDLSADIRSWMEKAGKGLRGIREFLHRLPLLPLVRFLLENPAWQPRSFSGGEDWFVLFKRFWKDRLQREYRLFTLARERQELDAQAEEYLGEPLRHKEYPYTRFSHSLSLAEGFLRVRMLPKMNYYLKIILVDGEFYKADNRQEFTEGYNDLFLVKDELRQFRDRLSSGGDWGRVLEMKEESEEGSEEGADEGKKPELQEQIDREGELLADRSFRDISALAQVIGGIAGGGGGKEYDSLTNIEFIAGSENRSFRDDLAEVGQALQEGAKLLENMKTTESEMI